MKSNINISNFHFCFIYTVAPQIQASGITLALLGERVELKCTVKAKPTPKVIFWRDHEGRIPVIIGKNYEMTMEANSEVSSSDISISVINVIGYKFVKLTKYYIIVSYHAICRYALLS